MLQDYESIKSDYDIVTVLLKGKTINPFRIDVLRSRKIGSVSRYLCEYRGLNQNSFVLLDNNNKKIANTETIADICDSGNLQIFVLIKKNIKKNDKKNNPIPENGDHDNVNSSMKNNNGAELDTSIGRDFGVKTKKIREPIHTENRKNGDDEVDKWEKNKQKNLQDIANISQVNSFILNKNIELKKKSSKRKNETNDIVPELKNKTFFLGKNNSKIFDSTVKNNSF